MNDYSFGNFLRELRERCGLSQYQLGLLVGVTDKSVSKWENGICKPKAKILYDLSEILGITTDELLSCKYIDSNERKGVFVMKSELWQIAENMLYTKYGKNLPIEILNRYLSEYAEFKDSDVIIYLNLIGSISKTVAHNKEDIRLRGTIGSSFIAYLLGATDINPLKPHYYCPNCKRVEFCSETNDGWDLPNKNCSCGQSLEKDGHNIPFEMVRQSFLKNSDFDILVSSTMYPAVKSEILNYFKGNKLVLLKYKQEQNYEKIVVINDDNSDFADGETISYEENRDRIKKYPCIILSKSELLENLSELFKKTNTFKNYVDFANQKVLEGIISGNTDGIPEYSSSFLKELIVKTNAKTFYDLIKLSGLAHGWGVWDDNAEVLVNDGFSLEKVIAYRDDVFNHIQNKLSSQGIQNTGYAYKMAENVRRGLCKKHGISQEERAILESFGVEPWFIESIQKIKYLFPKSHGVMFAKQALLLMWYKLNYPKEYSQIMLGK